MARNIVARAQRAGARASVLPSVCALTVSMQTVKMKESVVMTLLVVLRTIMPCRAKAAFSNFHRIKRPRSKVVFLSSPSDVPPPMCWKTIKPVLW